MIRRLIFVQVDVSVGSRVLCLMCQAASNKINIQNGNESRRARVLHAYMRLSSFKRWKTWYIPYWLYYIYFTRTERKHEAFMICIRFAVRTNICVANWIVRANTVCTNNTNNTPKYNSASSYFQFFSAFFSSPFLGALKIDCVCLYVRCTYEFSKVVRFPFELSWHSSHLVMCFPLHVNLYKISFHLIHNMDGLWAHNMSSIYSTVVHTTHSKRHLYVPLGRSRRRK